MALENESLTSWYLRKHPGYEGKNSPNSDSERFLEQLGTEILLPIENSFGDTIISYGFTSHSLLLYIKKHSPGHMAPDVDQHASMELNSRGNRICKADGASCDFLVSGYEIKMSEIARYITSNLAFDRLYYYGSSNPLHISVGPDNRKMAILMQTGDDGVRRPGRRAEGGEAVSLF